MFWRKPKSLFVVLMHLSGRHPYREETDLDFPTRDIEVPVQATDWTDAERQAFKEMPRTGDHYACWVKAIRRAGVGYEAQRG